MTEVKLIYTITPETPKDAHRVIKEIKNDMDMLPSSIILNEKEFEIKDEKELYDLINWI